MLTDLSFLNSKRFWGLIAIAIIGVLIEEGILSSEVGQALIKIIGGFIAIRTIDRFSEKIGKGK